MSRCYIVECIFRLSHAVFNATSSRPQSYKLAKDNISSVRCSDQVVKRMTNMQCLSRCVLPCVLPLPYPSTPISLDSVKREKLHHHYQSLQRYTPKLSLVGEHSSSSTPRDIRLVVGQRHPY